MTTKGISGSMAPRPIGPPSPDDIDSDSSDSSFPSVSRLILTPKAKKACLEEQKLQSIKQRVRGVADARDPQPTGIYAYGGVNVTEKSIGSMEPRHGPTTSRSRCFAANTHGTRLFVLMRKEGRQLTYPPPRR